MDKKKICIADCHPVVRQGIRAIFSRNPDYIVHEAENGLEAIVFAKTLKVDVILMDTALPFLDGIRATARISKEFPNTKVIIFSEERNYAFEAFKAGAMGFIVKEAKPEELLIAVEEVLKRNKYVSPQIADQLIDNFMKNDRCKEPFDTLSSREIEVVELVADGKTNKEIAKKLCIAESTVKTHRLHVMEKLKVKDTAGLIRAAVLKGLSKKMSNR